MSFVNHLIRFLVASLVLLLVGFLVPGFHIREFSTAIWAALVISALGWLVETFLGGHVSPYGRGLIGFLSMAFVIYLAGWIVDGVYVTVIGSLLAALLTGIIDLFLPARARYWSKE